MNVSVGAEHTFDGLGAAVAGQARVGGSLAGRCDVGAARPKPIHECAWASVKREARDVIHIAFDHAERRDPEHARHWGGGRVDRNEAHIDLAHAEAHRRNVHITLVVDLIHVLEHLWRAAHVSTSTVRATPRRG